MTTRVTASAETLMRQAGYTAEVYLAAAIKDIDAHLGEGYAAKHPELIGAFMQTAALDYQAGSITSGLQDITEAMRDAADELRRAIDTVGDDVAAAAQTIKGIA